jgi:hypothetical protein
MGMCGGLSQSPGSGTNRKYVTFRRDCEGAAGIIISGNLYFRPEPLGGGCRGIYCAGQQIAQAPPVQHSDAGFDRLRLCGV